MLESQARLNIAIGNQYPQQQALAGSVDYQYANTGLLNSSTDFTSNRIGIGATWEIDFWGKFASNEPPVRDLEEGWAGFDLPPDSEIARRLGARGQGAEDGAR